MTSRLFAGTVAAMLDDAPLIAFVSVTDATRARHFYVGLLGLTLVEQGPFALECDCAGTALRVTLVNHVTPAPYTVLGWRVENIEETVQKLKAAGVALQTFDGLDQSLDGIWQSPSGARVAWFKDPDGNLLSVTQFQPMRRP